MSTEHLLQHLNLCLPKVPGLQSDVCGTAESETAWRKRGERREERGAESGDSSERVAEEGGGTGADSSKGRRRLPEDAVLDGTQRGRGVSTG